MPTNTPHKLSLARWSQRWYDAYNSDPKWRHWDLKIEEALLDWVESKMNDNRTAGSERVHQICIDLYNGIWSEYKNQKPRRAIGLLEMI